MQMENIEFIYQSEKCNIYSSDSQYYIDVFEKVDTNSIYKMLLAYPSIVVTDFKAMRDALSSPPQKGILFGKKAPPINLEISSNYMSAWIKISMSLEEFEKQDSKKLFSEIMELLKEKRVVFGILYDFINDLKANEKILVAKGLEPINGIDSMINFPDLTLKKVTEAQNNGNVDFHNLDSIYNVGKGDWVGERINATDGTPGKNLLGDVINPTPGKNSPLYYDKKTIEAIEEGNKIVLRATIDGALSYQNDNKTLSVFPCIEVNDVDLTTGNIQTDCFLIIKGTVSDGFKVYAKKGIDVRGKVGIGNCSLISEGDISITSGISARGECLIESSGNVSTKFVNFATIKAKGTVTVIEYSYHSNITANTIYIGKNKTGKVVGGVLTATYKIEVQEAGTQLEKSTLLETIGFDREILKKEQFENAKEIENLKTQMNRSLQKLKIIKSSTMTDEIKKNSDLLLEEINSILRNINSFESRNSEIIDVLNVKGEGIIKIHANVYPKSQIKIKDQVEHITDTLKTVTYYYENGLKTLV
jgi:uncharacterized protein (DUF342 family)